jgi:GDP-mannose 6-dehydrogenase
MKIAIYGMGYVGLTAAACLTKDGHEVIGVDVSDDKVAKVNAGVSPIAEPGLEELLREALDQGRLSATTSPGGKIDDCDMAIVCVGTPSAPDGSHNMSFIAEVSRQIAASVSRNRTQPLTVVYRSTIRPGTMEGLIAPVFKAILGEYFEKLIELVYNPEFLRESVAIKDYFNPPKIVIGTKDGARSANMDALHENIVAPVFYTAFREAEFTKFVDNTWHAVKVAYANEIGRVCVELGISAKKVHEIFVSDTKLNISAYYMRPGGAFGGSCLPKDVRALQYMASDLGASTSLIDSVIRTNEAHKHFLYEYCVADVPVGGEVLLVGLSFKANSDDLRESPNVDMARKLLAGGYKLSIYDPNLVPSQLVGQNLGYAYSQLPTISNLLVSHEAVVSRQWDLVVDANGSAASLTLNSRKTVSTNALP